MYFADHYETSELLHIASSNWDRALKTALANRDLQADVPNAPRQCVRKHTPLKLIKPFFGNICSARVSRE